MPYNQCVHKDALAPFSLSSDDSFGFKSTRNSFEKKFDIELFECSDQDIVIKPFHITTLLVNLTIDGNSTSDPLKELISSNDSLNAS